MKKRKPATQVKESKEVKPEKLKAYKPVAVVLLILVGADGPCAVLVPLLLLPLLFCARHR